MQQDPSSWNKHLYRTKSPATTSTAAATATATAVSSSAVSAAVVAVAVSSTATAPGTATGPSALPPPNIHSRSSASTPCLTSSHVRPNTNRNSDVLAIHPSFDLSRPSLSDLSSPSASSPISSPATHLDAINAIAYQPEHEPSLSHSISPASPDTVHTNKQHEWVQYKPKPVVSFRDAQKDRAHHAQRRAIDRRFLETSLDHDNMESTGSGSGARSRFGKDSDMASETSLLSPDDGSKDTTLERVRITSNRGALPSPSSRLGKVVPMIRNNISDVDLRTIGRDSELTMHRSSTKGAVPNHAQAILNAQEALPASSMSPGDIYHLSSSLSPASPGTASNAANSSSSSSSSVSATSAPSITSSLSSSPSPGCSTASDFNSPPLSPACQHTHHFNGTPHLAAEEDRTSLPLGSNATTAIATSTSSGSSLLRPFGQVSPAPGRRDHTRETIFVPQFLSGPRPSSAQSGSFIDVSQHQQDTRPQDSPGTAHNHHSPDTIRPHIVVTDVRSISFRDISTVPTLTTFGHRRSKRRNSSVSHSSSPASAEHIGDEASFSTTSLQPSTSRRKRIKKSSHSTRTPINLCTSSCGCSDAQGLTEEPHSSAERMKEHRVSSKSRKNRSMESTGRIRTISESNAAVTDRGQSSHRPLHKREQHHSRPLPTHQLGQGQERDIDSASGLLREPLSEQQQAHIQHHHQHYNHHQHHPSTPQHPLQDTQHMRSDSPSEHQPQVHQHQHLRIQLHPEREPHHKRQRSPPAQITTFESLIPSPSTQAANNMERLKRARHRISTAPESAMDSSMEHPGGDQQMSWRDRTDQGQHSQQDKRDEMVLHPLNRHRDSDETHMQHSIQHRQHPTRIHPFDSEPTTAPPSETANAPIIPKMAPVTRVEPSIHPLDTREPSSSTVLKEHRFDTKDATPSSATTSRELAAPQQGSDVQSPSAVRVEMEATSRLIESQRRGKAQDSTVKDAAKDVVSTRPPSSATSTKATPAPTLAPVPAPAPEVPTSTAVTLNLPITRETLHELDMPEVFKNAQLRHDIVFDPHLQFRPNFDGERGLVKKREADRFWREVGLELNNRRLVLAARREAAATMLSLAGLSSSSPTSRLIQQQAQQMCPLPKAVLLPRLIDELREILLSLLPANQAAAPGGHQAGDASQVNPERALLISTLDPDLILQELDHGVLNVHALFRFLGDSLKGHCAPMRDALVETMVSAVVDLDEIVRGIRMCFEILEYMKLDIANHQLRIMRPWLLDKSIDFEQQYFAALLTRGGTINRTSSWLKRSWIQWESVKRSVIDQPSSANDIPSHAGAGSRRASLALTAGPSDAEQTGGHPKAFFNPKRRSSIIRTEIGENILDGVVNEGLLDMILRPHEAVHTMPETFELDHYRMLSFHNDFQDLTILCMLLILFRQLAQNCWTQQDLVEIKKVVWLLLTDENANFGANTNPGPATAAAAAATGSAAGKEGADAGISNGMKDIVVQIEFAARKVRERSKNSTVSASTSSNTTATSASSAPASSAALPPTAAAAAARAVPSTGLSASETNLLTAWLNNALNKTSTLYVLIQKRLLIHFRRWLYLHSCSSMMVLSASCASLASAMSLSSASSASSLPSSAASAADGDETDNEDEEDASQGKVPASSAQEATGSGVSKDGVEAGRDLDQESANGNGKSIGNVQAPSSNKGAVQGQGQGQGQHQGRPQRPQNQQQQQQPPSKSSASGSSDAATVTSAELSPEEANKAAAEALAAKLSFNATEMEAHGLTGLEDEMIALLEKIRALSEFNKKVYGSWYRDLVKQGRAENWLDVTTTTTTATTMTSV